METHIFSSVILEFPIVIGKIKAAQNHFSLFAGTAVKCWFNFIPQCQCQSCLLRVLKTIAGVESAASMWGDSQARIQTYGTLSCWV